MYFPSCFENIGEDKLCLDQEEISCVSIAANLIILSKWLRIFMGGVPASLFRVLSALNYNTCSGEDCFYSRKLWRFVAKLLHLLCYLEVNSTSCTSVLYCNCFQCKIEYTVRNKKPSERCKNLLIIKVCYLWAMYETILRCLNLLASSYHNIPITRSVS